VVATDVVGREQELATVARLFEQRRAGPWVVVIEGDAGIGKTTLWEAALDLARDRSWRVLAARPAEAEVRFPTLPFVTCSARS
jgi:predicted ATPase